MRIAASDLYDYIANEEDARVCKGIPDEACREVPGNFFKILVSQWLTKTADALSSTKVVLPWLLTSIGVPAFFIGMLVPLRESGSLLPQLLIGGYIRSYSLRKYFFALGSLVQAACVLGIALVGYSLTGVQAGFSIIVLLAIFSLARGLCSVASKDVLGKTIPKSRRGLLNGYSASGAGFITLLFGGALLLPWQVNNSMILVYLVAAAACWLLAAGLYSTVQEERGATEGGGNALQQAWKNLSLLTKDRDFRRFVSARGLLVCTGLAAPYFVLLANTQDSSVLTLGYLLITNGSASLLAGPFWGRFADLSSRRVMIASAVCVSILCFIAAVSSQFSMPVWLVMLAFFVLSVAHQGVRLGRKTYIVDLAGGNKRTDYVSVSNSVIGALLLLVGALAALLAQLDLWVVLTVFGLLSALAAWICSGLPEVSQD